MPKFLLSSSCEIASVEVGLTSPDAFGGTEELLSLTFTVVQGGKPWYTPSTRGKAHLAGYAKPPCDSTHCHGNSLVDECECADVGRECECESVCVGLGKCEFACECVFACVRVLVFVSFSVNECIRLCSACGRLCAVAALPRLAAIGRIPAREQKRRQGPQRAERGTRYRGERAAPRLLLPRRLCPLNRSPSRLQLISHVTFYLLSPRAICPRTVLLWLPQGLGSRNFGRSGGRPGGPRGLLSTPAAGAPGASLSPESGGPGLERAGAPARRPLGPRGAEPRRPAECPERCVVKGGALSLAANPADAPSGERAAYAGQAGKSVRYNEGHALYLAFLARKEGTKRGFLSKKAAEASRWHEKWFALYQNVLFYFEGEQSGRPAGMYLLEGCSCERAPAPPRMGAGPAGARDALDKQYYFTVLFGHEGQKPLELRCEEEQDGKEWMEAIHQASYADILIEREVLTQKYIHLVQIVETEKIAANQLRHQLEDQDTEIERLKSEIIALNKTKERMRPYQSNQEDEDPDIKKIKKVQSFMRGWLCRRKWKTIVQDYICSPHAESMRKRNQIVFTMVEAESEYVHQLCILVNGFLRPLRMAASSKKPPISHDDVSSIFLNSETIMFLHEIFHQGLKARIANWPTLILADLFDILLPMLNIYQEFVRNHQYSLQVLANCKQNRDFDKLLKQYEANPACEGRMLETFLTYPMFQIPRYIITLHELLAHTPHEHVERKSLEFAKSKLEELSRVMHDEVSDTENIRKNLAIERMIVEGCDILLDTSQTFIRQGSLIQVPSVERGKLSKVRLGSLSLKKEGERQCFLFTKHFLICTRSSGGKLHLLKAGGVLSLIECTLIEEPDASDDDPKGSGQVFGHLDFKIVVEPPDSAPFTVVLLAPSRQEKAAWTSDISQCVDNIRCNGLMTIVFEENSKVTVPHMIKSDARLHKDDTDICFSKTLNSCKVPQIRYASVERLLERLTDLRFLSIDFLNTFLHTYRIFTTAAVVLAKLSDIYKRPFTSIPVRSLELFFATSQNNRGEHLVDGKSPRLCRKFSSPPPLAVSRTSSPVRARKLSLTSPLNSKIGALDLTTSSASSSPTTTHSPAASPPPHTGKVPLDLSRSLSSPEQSPGSVKENVDNPRVDLCNKLKRSIQRAVLESAPVDRAGMESSPAADAAELSPCRSPSTPRHLRYRQPGGENSERDLEKSK
ncbi:ras-specific guanine nucleotide-releasing factor 2 [Loxodonta africana]|uniref:ras-specific guanine nucleotide-releasing factor 2 n=1 Tax=Loxodonta africana TaxID=9785 RepID=UPI0030D336C4